MLIYPLDISNNYCVTASWLFKTGFSGNVYCTISTASVSGRSLSIQARNPIASQLKRIAIAPKSNSKAIAPNSTQVEPAKPTLEKLYIYKNICRKLALSNPLNDTQIVSTEFNCRSTDRRSSIQSQTYSFKGETGKCIPLS